MGFWHPTQTLVKWHNCKHNCLVYFSWNQASCCDSQITTKLYLMDLLFNKVIIVQLCSKISRYSNRYSNRVVNYPNRAVALLFCSIISKALTKNVAVKLNYFNMGAIIQAI